MKLMILSIAARYLLPLLLLLSVFSLSRGHNDPGGGFVGGLIAAAALVLYALANGVRETREVLRISPRNLIGIGLLTTVVSGLIPMFLGKPFMTGLWSWLSIPIFGKIGSPLLFDIGVYLTVAGVTLLIILSLAEE